LQPTIKALILGTGGASREVALDELDIAFACFKPKKAYDHDRNATTFDNYQIIINATPVEDKI
jgi:shikimate dehydrogenase